MRSFLFFILLSCISGFSTEFHSKFNHKSEDKIIRFKICGERCSGTNFLAALVSRNFSDVMNIGYYGHKHFLEWFEFSPPNTENMEVTNPRFAVEDADDCLFIVIVRNPLDWLRSFYLIPHHVDRSVSKQGFSHFLRAEWKPRPLPTGGPVHDTLNPYTMAPFSNVLELRSYKHRNYLALSSKVKNYCIVRYEDVSADPEGFIQYLANFFDLQASEEFIPIDDYKGLSKKDYKPKEYFTIPYEDQRFISKHLDSFWEEQVGYPPFRYSPFPSDARKKQGHKSSSKSKERYW